MKVREIKEITEKARIERESINRALYEIYKHDRKEAERSSFFRRVSYKKLFLISVESKEGLLENVKFGWRSSYPEEHAPDIMLPPKAPFLEEHLDRQIQTFCEKYHKAIFAGIPIKELVQMDPENILQYEPLPMKEPLITLEKIKQLSLKYTNKKSS